MEVELPLIYIILTKQRYREVESHAKDTQLGSRKARARIQLFYLKFTLAFKPRASVRVLSGGRTTVGDVGYGI